MHHARRTPILVLAFASWAVASAASAAKPIVAKPAAVATPAPAPTAAPALSAAYGRLLAQHVHPGTIDRIPLNVVDYEALGGDPDYAQALRDFADAKPEQLRSDKERFAFWVNAYNLLAIKTVVDRYPLKSIRDGGTFFLPIWKRKVGRIAGRELALDDIEHGILRAKFDEPRLHFAIVCASLSCPDLRPEPYDAARLDVQLDDQARSFLANTEKGMLPDPDGARARVSSIFKWFRDDFTPTGGVAQFIKSHADPAVAAKIPHLTDDGLSYLDYNWSLNDARRAARP